MTGRGAWLTGRYPPLVGPATRATRRRSAAGVRVGLTNTVTHNASVLVACDCATTASVDPASETENRFPTIE